MENFLQTALIAALLVAAAFFLIGIGWLFSGRQKIKRGGCGRDPNTLKEQSCGKKVSCQLCGEEKEGKGERGDE